MREKFEVIEDVEKIIMMENIDETDDCSESRLCSINLICFVLGPDFWGFVNPDCIQQT